MTQHSRVMHIDNKSLKRIISERIIICTFLLFGFYLPSLAQMPLKPSASVQYLWAEVQPIYAQAQADAQVLGSIFYGDSLQIFQAYTETKQQVSLFPEALEQASAPLSVAAYWFKIAYQGQDAYVLSSYLAPFPPPSTKDMYLSFTDFLQKIAPIKSSKEIGNTPAFCSRIQQEHAYGIEYTFTNFGPCETCGQYQIQWYIPKLSPETAWMLNLYFYKQSQGSTLQFQEASSQLEQYFEYGPVQSLKIIKQQAGILITEDTYL